MSPPSFHLVSELFRHHLVDELRLLIHPVALGGERRIFGDVAMPSVCGGSPAAG